MLGSESTDPIEPSEPTGHRWYKSYLVTRSDDRGMYDTMKCKECGITGKRYGLGGEGIIRDKPWKKPARVFENCKLTQEFQKTGELPKREKQKLKKPKDLSVDEIIEFITATSDSFKDPFREKFEKEEGDKLEIKIPKFFQRRYGYLNAFVDLQGYSIQNYDVDMGFYQVWVFDEGEGQKYGYPEDRIFMSRTQSDNTWHRDGIITRYVTERAFISAFWNKSTLAEEFLKWREERDMV